MKIREVMSPDPVCCLPTDSAQQVAKIMADHNVGSIPIVTDQDSRKLVGVVTDRDLCCSVVAAGLDPKTTKIEQIMTANPITCRRRRQSRNLRAPHAGTSDQAHSHRGRGRPRDRNCGPG